MLQFFRIAIRNLIKHQTRSLILGGAIMSVTILLTILLSLSNGLQDNMMKGATTLLSGYVNIAGFYKISQSSASPIIHDIDVLKQIARDTVPEATIIIDRVKAWGKLISEANSIQLPMWGVHIEQEEAILGDLSLAKKSDYIENYVPTVNEPEASGNILDLAERGTIAIFASQAKKLQVQVGDQITVSMPTYRNTSNTLDVKVVAILKNMGMLSNFSVFLNAVDSKEIYQVEETTSGQVMIFLNSTADVSAVEDRLRQVFSAKGYQLMEKEAAPFWMKFDRVAGESWTGERLDITTWKDEASFMKWIIDIFNGITFLLTVVLMVIVVLGLINALWMSVKERTSEIGTLRAIGLRRRKVMLMFFMEAMTLSVFSTLVGLLLGAGLAVLLDSLELPVTSEAMQMFVMTDTLSFQVSAMSLIITFCTIGLFVTIGALLPAYAASKMKPITAINYIN